MNLFHENGNNNNIDDKMNHTANNVDNTLKLLDLLEEINSNGFSEPTVLQSKINLYLKNLLNVEYVLLVPVLPANSTTSEGLIQVVNDKVLDKEFRFSVSVTIIIT
jgi:hypothetical protein